MSFKIDGDPVIVNGVTSFSFGPDHKYDLKSS